MNLNDATVNLTDVDVWVIDSSALIDMKKIISVSNQWGAFKHLEKMVDDGEIAMPSQVINELKVTWHPDLPGAWAVGMRNRLKHDPKVDYTYFPEIMKIAKDVIDTTKFREDADIFVLAQSTQIQKLERGKLPLKNSPLACIVTDDKKDRDTISIKTACSKLDIPWCPVREFLKYHGIKMLKDKNSYS